MNLYIEGSKALRQVLERKTSIKNVVYTSDFGNKKQLLALVCETLKYSYILQKVVRRLKLLEREKFLKNDELLAQVLLHDFAIIGGLVRPGKLKQTMTRHKAEIYAELERLMTKAGVDNVKALISQTENELPRYARVNLLLTSVQKVIDNLIFGGWEEIQQPSDMPSFLDAVKNLRENQFIKDFHLPDVLVFPSGTDFHDNEMCSSAEIILQEKASCFPAHILSVPEGATVIDCCAAPGNKTSHVASLTRDTGKIFAFDKDGRRIATLQKLTAKAGIRGVRALCQDFLRANTNDEKYANVEYVLVDPSCSGSGIVSRMDNVTSDSTSSSKERLEKLSRFQMMILKHALNFPSVRRLVYSTCSIHSEENESVIEEVYSQVSHRYKLSKVMPDWPIRGQDGFKHSKYFLRMSPSESLTNGFFVACFKRRKGNKNTEEDEEEDSRKRKCEIEEDNETKTVSKVKKARKKKEPSPFEDSVLENECYVSEMRLSVEKDLDSTMESTEVFNSKNKKHKKKRKLNHDEVSYDNEKEVTTIDVNIENTDHKRKKHKKKKQQMQLNLDCDKSDESVMKNGDMETAECTVKKHKKKKKHKEVCLEMDTTEKTVKEEEKIKSKKDKRKKKN